MNITSYFNHNITIFKNYSWGGAVQFYRRPVYLFLLLGNDRLKPAE